jgi:NTP pyrophosphatase (non-canonical NTP hydrolase)
MKTLDTHQQLFVITAEECGELTQVCSKILRNAAVDDKWNKKLLEEVGDIYCMIDLIVQHGYLNWEDITKRSNVKKQKLLKWSNLIT